MRISAALNVYISVDEETHFKGRVGHAMQAKTSADDRQETRRETPTRSSKLYDRYGKIGIRAVAAAVRCRGEERKSRRARLVPQDSD